MMVMNMVVVMRLVCHGILPDSRVAAR